MTCVEAAPGDEVPNSTIQNLGRGTVSFALTPNCFTRFFICPFCPPSGVVIARVSNARTEKSVLTQRRKGAKAQRASGFDFHHFSAVPSGLGRVGHSPGSKLPGYFQRFLRNRGKSVIDIRKQIAGGGRMAYFRRVARVAQLDRASASEAEGCGFDPRLAHQSSLSAALRATTRHASLRACVSSGLVRRRRAKAAAPK
jgi:hypothetical protein